MDEWQRQVAEALSEICQLRTHARMLTRKFTSKHHNGAALRIERPSIALARSLSLSQEEEVGEEEQEEETEEEEEEEEQEEALPHMCGIHLRVASFHRD